MAKKSRFISALPRKLIIASLWVAHRGVDFLESVAREEMHSMGLNYDAEVKKNPPRWDGKDGLRRCDSLLTQPSKRCALNSGHLGRCDFKGGA